MAQIQAVNHYQKRIRKKKWLIGILFLLLIFTLLSAVKIGIVSLSFRDIFRAIFAQLWPSQYSCEGTIQNIVIGIRLPRIIMGALVGLGLGAAGALVQTILMNPMASPYTLGISSGAGLGASLAIIYSFGLFGLQGKAMVIGNAFIFAMGVSLLILLIARIRNNARQDLILAGIAFMNIFNAITTLITYFADVYASKEIMYWQVGSLGKADWQSVKVVGLIMLLLLPYIFSQTGKINKMALGDEVAQSLGVDVKKFRLFLMLLLSFLVAAVTAFTGMIGFVGLVVPHVMRLMVGSDNQFLIPASALGGGILLVLADTVALNLIAPKVLPVGVLTAFIGSPIFLVMIFRSKRKRYHG